MDIVLILFSLFLASNMGVSGFATSFTPSYGSNLLTKNRAVILYTLSVLAGGLIFGPKITATLVEGLAGGDINLLSSLIIIASSSLTIFISNKLKVPQSTSFVTVAAFTGAGIYNRSVNTAVLYRIFIFAAIFSILSFAVTIILKKLVYPPRKFNLLFYEQFYRNRSNLQKFIVATDVYGGFSIGSNNLANIVAPLAFITLPTHLALAVVALFFGLGAFIGGERVIKSFSKDIAYLGEFSSSLISIVTGTLVVISSALGLPAPFVQFTTFSLLAISCAKDGFRETFSKGVVKKILFVWIIVPLSTLLISYLLHLLLRVNL